MLPAEGEHLTTGWEPDLTPDDTLLRATPARDAAPARLRAHTAATGHATAHGQLPTVTELMALAKSPEAPPPQP